ncbi:MULTISPECIES: PIN-like domain-containing protein [unclassified Rhizobium]|uniref:PIN-like domain-containing protein n=1 Tax=unclassified Rhizobium TaxID=2613769 RepID=UPI001160B839|nr:MULTISPECIES: PIN-like domain-containing protein [unclassified Rhizobium]TQX84445.1 hypothetical protein EQW76_25000 [Rhizobium sp. rho-13.1]TQY05249.1 hypothetical protein EQW74_27540 [Rhizobium sp. rho-1.1]
MSEMNIPATDVDIVFAILERETEIDAIDALMSAMRPEPDNVTLARTALAFDANVLLKIGKYSWSDDLSDALRAQTLGPLIVPGQVIQEFWNNQFQAIDSKAESVKKKFEQLKTDVDGVDETFGGFAERFNSLLDEFAGDFGYIYDDKTSGRIFAFLDVLKDKALVPFAPRERFSRTASSRKLTKTPPGFKDPGDGDFFVWADLLVGLKRAQSGGADFGRVVMVTMDQKIDWSRGGTAHPILSAEIKALTGATFETWNLEKLKRLLLDEVAPQEIDPVASTEIGVAPLVAATAD